MAKPKPLSIKIVCSECGLSWEDHTKGRKTDPTADVCIRLLKAELLKRPTHPLQWSGSAVTSTTAPNHFFTHTNAATN